MKKVLFIAGCIVIVAGIIFASLRNKDGSVGEANPTPPIDGNTVALTESGFAPRELTIKKGEIVTFVNQTENPSWPASDIHPSHTIYPGSGIAKCATDEKNTIFDACRGLEKGEAFSFTFNEAGTWRFHDHLSPAMKGTVIVTEQGMTTEMEESGAVEKSPAPAPAPSPTPAASAMKTFNLTTEGFSFSQKEIRVKKGDKVKIILSVSGGFHDWVLDEFTAATKRISAGQIAEVEFIADKTGTFEYYCSVGSHRTMGMVGKLIVE